jgi:uncharacterized RDD family membrane protein YckC
MTTTTATLAGVNNAGFGQRLLALIIDVIVIGILQSVVIAPILAAVGFGLAPEIQSMEGMSQDEAAAAAGGMIATVMATMGTVILLSYAIQVVYNTLMESSKWQGTLGKMALGIKVTDMEGNRISIGKAFLRAFGKIISGSIMLIGYLMAAFTEKKQALHDLIASTLVVKK